jgi:hypothetical protein
MKANYLKAVMALAVLGGMTLSAPMVLAQDTSAIAATNTIAPVAAPTAPVTPPLAYGVSQILQLAQAKVSDDTIIAFVRNSGNSYGLSADQIIYLQKQGLSSAVITAMLNQPRTGALASTPAPATPTPASDAPAPAAPASAAPDYTQSATSTATVAPTVTYVETQPATTYYYPYYYSYGYPYYYPAYGFYPGVSVSLGWGRGWGGWHGGGGFHGGWHR